MELPRHRQAGVFAEKALSGCRNFKRLSRALRVVSGDYRRRYIKKAAALQKIVYCHRECVPDTEYCGKGVRTHAQMRVLP